MQIQKHMDMVLKGEENSTALMASLRKFVENRREYQDDDLDTMKRAAATAFSFCHRLVNELRQVIKVRANFVI